MIKAMVCIGHRETVRDTIRSICLETVPRVLQVTLIFDGVVELIEAAGELESSGR